jgi:hypothetical protein
MNHLIERAYTALTGKPYKTVRSMAKEYGPLPATLYPELLRYTDEELLQVPLYVWIWRIEDERYRAARASRAMAGSATR